MLKYSNRPSVTKVVKVPVVNSAQAVYTSPTTKSVLYLGPLHSAEPLQESRITKTDRRNKNATENPILTTLREAHITAIVNCTKKAKNHFEEDQVDYCRVDVADREGVQICLYFDAALGFMQHHLEAGHSVLVHCMRGVSRSATIVIAFLIRYAHMTRDEAYVHIKRRRQFVNPNQSFWQQLNAWEKKCEQALNQKTITSSEKMTKEELSAIKKKADEEDTSSENQVPSFNLGKLDMDWAGRSAAIFKCRWNNPFEDLSTLLSHDTDSEKLKTLVIKQAMTTALDFVMGRGANKAILAWLHGLCDYFRQHSCGVANIVQAVDDIDEPVIVAQQLLQSETFRDNWTGELTSERMEHINEALIARPK